MASTVQPMENMTIASMMVSVVLIARLRTWLKLSGGTRQFGPEHTVARGSHLMGAANVAMATGSDLGCDSAALLSGKEKASVRRRSVLAALYVAAAGREGIKN